jgi:hypothetical protein
MVPVQNNQNPPKGRITSSHTILVFFVASLGHTAGDVLNKALLSADALMIMIISAVFLGGSEE